VLALALLAPATAFATHSFTDVPDGQFYTEAVEWAKANGMTTGCGDRTAFCTNDPVTRAENITFAKRYDDFVVQPALTTLSDSAAANSAGVANTYTKAEVDAAVLAAMLGTATIPSGTTVTGRDGWEFWATEDGDDMWFPIQLPGRVPVALTELTVNFAPHASASDPEVTCTGSVAVPTAPAGNVCIYTNDSEHAAGFLGWNSFEPSFDDQLFYVNFDVDIAVPADVWLRVSWAYTAP